VTTREDAYKQHLVLVYRVQLGRQKDWMLLGSHCC
jgi:hypothetical protein